MNDIIEPSFTAFIEALGKAIVSLPENRKDEIWEAFLVWKQSSKTEILTNEECRKAVQTVLENLG
jgi:hypothetical protein